MIPIPVITTAAVLRVTITKHNPDQTETDLRHNHHGLAE